MPPELLNILEYECSWFFAFKNRGNIEKQRSSCIRKSLLFTNNTKGLAGETGKQQVVIWDVLRADLRYVSNGTISKI